MKEKVIHCENCQRILYIKDEKPDYSILSIHIDGAARGNPGPAGIGIVITDANGIVVKNVDKFIGHATNNVAEYTALITGMEKGPQLRWQKNL